MDQADRDLLRETLRLAEVNNLLLRRMQFWGRVAFWVKVAVWTAVLLLPVLFYSRALSFMNILPGGAGSTSSSTGSLFGFPSPEEFVKAGHTK
jgi:hypothetical protein